MPDKDRGPGIPRKNVVEDISTLSRRLNKRNFKNGFSLDLRLRDMVTLATSGPDLQPVQGTENKRHI